VTFGSGAVKDLAGNAYAGTTTYDFKTAASNVIDTLPPESPLFKTWYPDTTSDLVFTFNENIKIADLNKISIYEVDSKYNQIGPDLNFATSVRGADLTIDPSVNLISAHKYGVFFESGAIADLAGNTWPDPNYSNSWIFTVIE
jgi:hypothetical protein